MIVLCCVVLYDFVHCLLLRRNNKYISGKTDDDVFYTYIHIQTNNACTYYMRIVTGAVTDRQCHTRVEVRMIYNNNDTVDATDNMTVVMDVCRRVVQ